MSDQLSKADGAVFIAHPRRLVTGWEASYSLDREARAGGPAQAIWKSQPVTFSTETAAFGWLESRAVAHGYDRSEIVWK